MDEARSTTASFMRTRRLISRLLNPTNAPQKRINDLERALIKPTTSALISSGRNTIGHHTAKPCRRALEHNFNQSMFMDIFYNAQWAEARGGYMGKNPDKSFEKIIELAVQRAFEAGRLSAGQTQKDAYKTTERRLYAIPTLRAKLAEERDDLARLVEEQAPDIVTHSTDIVRFRRSGVRLSDDDLLMAQLTDLRARIAAKEYEIKEIEHALDQIKMDYYYRTVSQKYFEGVADEVVADRHHCDPSTVRRNRARLVRHIAIWLYGPGAI